MSKWIPKFKINGVSIPIPNNYSQVISDISSESSGRTLDAKMHKDILGVKCSCPFKWEHLEWSEAAAIAKAIDGKKEIEVEYMDVRNPYKMTGATVYVGDRTCEPVQFSTNGKVYWSLSYNKIDI